MKSEMLLKRFHERLSLMLQAGLILGAALLALALGGCKNPAGGGEDGPRYTITFDADEGAFESSEAPARTALEGAALGEESMPAPPTKPGYTFAGWYTGLYGGGSTFDFSTPVTGDITVYAKWSPGAVVTFDADGGSPSGHSLMVSPGAVLGAASMPPEPAKTGFVFNGWWTEKEGGGTEFTQETPVEADITLYAKWIAFYTLTFDADGGEPPERSMTVSTGEAAGAEAVTEEPEKEGFSFGGWWTEKNGGGTRFTAETLVTADIAVYAKWIPMDSGVTVTFDAAGGTPSGRQRTVPQFAALGAASMPSEPAKSSNIFLGWYTAEGGGRPFTQDTPVIADMTVYAHWQLVRTVTFNSYGGSPVTQTRIIEDGDSLGELPIVNKNGLDYGGWYTEENGGGTRFTAETKVTADITVYAKWVALASFDPDGGTIGGRPEIVPRELQAGEVLGELDKPSKAGFTFGGWWTAKSGGGKQVSEDTPVNSHITLYAKWGYTVIFDPDRTGPSQQTLVITPGAAAGENMPAAALNHYTFDGWWTDKNGGGTQFTAETPVGADITVYAKWTVVRYLVTFDADGGNPGQLVVEAPYSSRVDALPSSAREGHTFDGWWTARNGGGSRFAAGSDGPAITEDITVYAKWLSTVTFNADGGAFPTTDPAETETRTVISGSPVGTTAMPPNPAKLSHAFKDWYTEPNGGGGLFSKDDFVNGHITVYAKWEPVFKNVTFSSAGGIPESQVRAVLLDAAVGADNMPVEPVFATNVYKYFGGWYTGPDGGGTQFTASTPVNDHITVYAKWIDGAAINLSATDQEQPASGAGWIYNSETKVYTILNGAKVTVTGKTTERRIVVESRATAVITLKDADIQFYNETPLDLQNATVTLILAGNNVLKPSGGQGTGLKASIGSVLVITSAAGDGSTAGTLTAQGSGNGAGIGGQMYMNGHDPSHGGDITIKGGTITATGTHRGAGIGGGGSTDGKRYWGNNGKVTITGGIVTARGGNDSVGIGGGYNGWGGEVYITGGTVTASSRTGIGASLGSGVGKIVISGGTVTAKGNTQGNGAGLGWENGSGGTITITGGTVIAEGRGKDIGGMVNAGVVTITGGSVKASKVLSPPANGGGAAVYLNTLTVGSAPVTSTEITAATIDREAGYGVKDVKTGADGKVYFWLPATAEGASGSVSLTAGGAVYSGEYERTSAGNTETLQ